MFDKKFVSPEVMRIVTISNKHGIQELLHQLPKNLKLRTLGSQEISRRCQNLMSCSLVLNLAPKLKFCQYQQKILEKRKLNFSRRVLFHRKAAVRPKYFGQDCLRKEYFCCNSPPSNLIYLTILVTIRVLIQFYPKIRATNWQKSVKICFTWELLFQSFQRGPNLVLKAFEIWCIMFSRKIK